MCSSAGRWEMWTKLLIFANSATHESCPWKTLKNIHVRPPDSGLMFELSLPESGGSCLLFSQHENLMEPDMNSVWVRSREFQLWGRKRLMCVSFHPWVGSCPFLIGRNWSLEEGLEFSYFHSLKVGKRQIPRGFLPYDLLKNSREKEKERGVCSNHTFLCTVGCCANSVVTWGGGTLIEWVRLVLSRTAKE